MQDAPRRPKRSVERDDDDEAPPYETRAKKSRRMETPQLKEPPRENARVTQKDRAKKALKAQGFTIDEDGVIEAMDSKRGGAKVRKMAAAAREVVEDAPPRRALTALPAPTPKQIEKALITNFGDKAEVVLQMLEINDSDGAISLLSRSLIQMLIGVLPLAEQNVRKSGGTKGIYQLNQLVSGIREMMIDLNNLRDKGDLGRSIVERHLRPSYQELGAQLAIVFNQLNDQARSRMTPQDYREYRQSVEGTRRDLASFMLNQYNEVKEGVAAALS